MILTYQIATLFEPLIEPLIETRLAIGDCIVQNDLEPWEPPYVYKIEMLGKRSYLVRRYPAPLHRDLDGIPLTFHTAEHAFNHIPCPSYK